MTITTSLAPGYTLRMVAFAVLCAVFGVWGIYDRFYKIPAQEQRFQQFQELKAAFEDLTKRSAEPGGLTDEAIKEYQRIEAELNTLVPDKVPPVQPGKFNKATQWAYISCLPFAPYLVWLLVKARRQKYRLDDDGTLHFEGDPSLGSGLWTQSDIDDIDMSRWMAKSIAHAVRKDGKRLKLDAYLHRRLDLIIGAIASRLHPQDWDADAKPVKPAAEQATEQASASASDAAPAVDADATG